MSELDLSGSKPPHDASDGTGPGESQPPSAPPELPATPMEAGGHKQQTPRQWFLWLFPGMVTAAVYAIVSMYWWKLMRSPNLPEPLVPFFILDWLYLLTSMGFVFLVTQPEQYQPFQWSVRIVARGLAIAGFVLIFIHDFSGRGKLVDALETDAGFFISTWVPIAAFILALVVLARLAKRYLWQRLRECLFALIALQFIIGLTEIGLRPDPDAGYMEPNLFRDWLYYASDWVPPIFYFLLFIVAATMAGRFKSLADNGDPETGND